MLSVLIKTRFALEFGISEWGLGVLFGFVVGFLEMVFEV